MSQLKCNLSNLKSKLQNISAQLDEQINQKTIKMEKEKSMNEKVIEVLKENNEIITINIGGKIFQTIKKNLLKDQDTLFYLLINEKDNINELFFDRNPRLFNYILDYLRYGKIDYKIFTKEDLNELFEEALFYELTDIRNYLLEKTKDITVVNMNYSGDYLYNGKKIGENDIFSLNCKEMTKGICCKSPGWVEFELNSLWEFEKLSIGGYQGNKSAWYPGNGCGAQILISENGKDFKKVGNIPSKFSKEIVEVKFPSKLTAKFVKIIHSSYLGIGYFFIEKDE